MSKQWEVEKTIKFIQVYKLHQCLWNFQSKDYRNKEKRDAAYVSIVQEMNIAGFGIQEVKNKIKNLRSTYSQEINKIQDSKKSGAGLSTVYNSNLKWLKEMEEVFSNDLKRKTYENINQPIHEDTSTLETGSTSSSQSHNNQEIPAFTSITSSTTTSTTTSTATTTSNSKTENVTRRPKKRTRDIVKAITDLKNMNEEVNSTEDTAFDIFGKSVAKQLKALSVENALLAQCRIQSILTEFGVKNHRQRTTSRSSMSNYSDHRSLSALSDTNDVNFYYDTSNDTINQDTSPTSVYHTVDSPIPSPSQISYTTTAPMISPSQISYNTPAPTASLSQISYNTPAPTISTSQISYSTPASMALPQISYNTPATLQAGPVSTDDIIKAAMTAAFESEC